jgi:hypothetical protein
MQVARQFFLTLLAGCSVVVLFHRFYSSGWTNIHADATGATHAFDFIELYTVVFFDADGFDWAKRYAAAAAEAFVSVDFDEFGHCDFDFAFTESVYDFFLHFVGDFD